MRSKCHNLPYPSHDTQAPRCFQFKKLLRVLGGAQASSSLGEDTLSADFPPSRLFFAEEIVAVPPEEKASKAKGRELKRGREDLEKVVKRWERELIESEREMEEEEEEDLPEAPSSVTQWESQEADQGLRAVGEAPRVDLGRRESREIYRRPSGELEQVLLEELGRKESGSLEEPGPTESGETGETGDAKTTADSGEVDQA